MEEAKCLMWLKSKHHNNHLSITKSLKKFNHEEAYYHQHEELAPLDVVASGTHIWPPRSYACTFCKREFKSAQALGGHMNVHRRDRALLKQVLINTPNNNNNPSTNTTSNSNSNSYKKHDDSRKLSKSMVSSRKNLVHYDPSFTLSSKISQSSYNYYVSARKVDHRHVKDENFRGQRNDDDGSLSYKRCKKNGGYLAILPSFLGETTIKCSNVKKEVGLHVPGIFSFKASKPMDDLDLELRLGNPYQKAK